MRSQVEFQSMTLKWSKANRILGLRAKLSNGAVGGRGRYGCWPRTTS